MLNVSPFLSGRYPALGPAVLADAGIVLVDRLEGVAQVRDGTRVRLRDDVVFAGDDAVAMGRCVDGRLLAEEMDAARRGLATQLETFTHNSTEFLRREESLLLHGQGMPVPATRLAGRPVVVVVDGHEHLSELRGIRSFLKEQKPVLVGVDGGAEVIRRAGFRPDVVVVGAGTGDHDLPRAETLRSARDVVVRVDRGQHRSLESLERLGVGSSRVETSATAEDVALLLADAGEASVIIGVGTHATLDDFLDRQRSGLASTYLTRLRVGQRLVDASAVPTLYSGRLRPRHLFLTLLLGVLAVAAAVATTPVGQDWAAAAWEWLRDALPRWFG